MATGAAVVASDIDGYRVVARDGLEALLVAPGDAKTLRAGLQRALTDDVHRRELIAAGERRAAEFSMDALATAFMDRYEAARRSRPAPIPVRS
jgi:phosphatidylinositol alpha-mannosyltransferase